MPLKAIQQISYLSLIHDVYYIVNSIDLNYDKNIFFETKWFDNLQKFDFTIKNLTKKKLDKLPLDDTRIIGELISEAENISLATEIDEKGELSPLKSIFSLNGRHDYFFNASEISENILLGTKKSKKNIYFAPSYLVSAFMDEFTFLTNKFKEPQINTLYFLIKKYFWSISLAHHGEDFAFSVFDHSKATCAIACSLYQYLREHHNNIFISRNIRVIREILANPTEPKFLFIKLFCDCKINRKNFSSKLFLLWASHIIINKFNLFAPSIFTATSDYSILILPNINNQMINDLITELNNFIFTNISADIQLSALFFPVGKNNICPHFSSSNKAGSLIFDNIINATPKTDTLFLDSKYDYFFTPQPVTDKDKKTDFNISDKIKSVSIAANSDTINFLQLNSNSISRNDNKNFTYFLTSDFNINTLAQSNCGYLLDNVNNNKITQPPKVTIKINVSNPELSLPYYPNISLINTLLNLTELITQLGIKNIIKKNSDNTLLNSSDNEISFTAKPLALKNVLKSIHDYYISIIGDCESIFIQAYIQTDLNRRDEYIKLNIRDKKNLVFIFNNFLQWNQIFELFEQADFLVNYYKTCNTDRKKFFIDFLDNTIKNKFFNVSELSNAVHEREIYEYFANVNNPFALTKFLDMTIKEGAIT